MEETDKNKDLAGKTGKGTMGFNKREPEPGKWDQYVGHYVTLSVPNLGNFKGFLKRLLEDGATAVMGSHVRTDYDEKKGAVKVIVEQERTLDLPFGTTMDYETEKSMRAYGIVSNREEKLRMRELKERERMIEEREKEENSKKKRSKKGNRS